MSYRRSMDIQRAMHYMDAILDMPMPKPRDSRVMSCHDALCFNAAHIAKEWEDRAEPYLMLGITEATHIGLVYPAEQKDISLLISPQQMLNHMQLHKYSQEEALAVRVLLFRLAYAANELPTAFIRKLIAVNNKSA